MSRVYTALAESKLAQGYKRYDDSYIKRNCQIGSHLWHNARTQAPQAILDLRYNDANPHDVATLETIALGCKLGWVSEEEVIKTLALAFQQQDLKLRKTQ